jgi:2-dehydropantoate 2-reductase
MHILVYGAGAVGCYLGAQLIRAGNDVVFVAREETAHLINGHGLAVYQSDEAHKRQAYKVQPPVVVSLRQGLLERPAYDLIILGMKSYSVELAINELVAYIPEPPPMLVVQNGIGIEEKFAEQFGAEQIISGALTTPLRQDARNVVIEEREDRGLALAPGQKGEKIDKWVDLFARAGILTEKHKNYQSVKWSKALVNMIGNATSAILNRHPRVVYEHEPLFELELEMMKEMLAVMKASRIKLVDLPGVQVNRLGFGVRRMPNFLLRPLLMKAVGEGRGDKLPSFQIDLNQGKKKNEVIYHNGAVARVAREKDIPAPVNTVLTTILLDMMNGKIDRDMFSGKPETLLKAIRQYKQLNPNI